MSEIVGAKDGQARIAMFAHHLKEFFFGEAGDLEVIGEDVGLECVVLHGELEPVLAGEDPRPQTVLYAQLPQDADEIEVILPGLKPVTVPVTR